MRKKTVAQVNKRRGGNPNHNLGRLYACGGTLPLKYLKVNMSKSVTFFQLKIGKCKPVLHDTLLSVFQFYLLPCSTLRYIVKYFV